MLDSGSAVTGKFVPCSISGGNTLPPWEHWSEDIEKPGLHMAEQPLVRLFVIPGSPRNKDFLNHIPKHNFTLGRVTFEIEEPGLVQEGTN